MKLEGWIAVINEGWIGDSDKKKLRKRLPKEVGKDWPLYKIRITVEMTAKTLTIPDGGSDEVG